MRNAPGGPALSVVIPVFNSEGSLEELHRRIRRVFPKPGALEVIYVDDGSRDGSWDILRRLRKRDPRAVHIVRLSRNYGQHNALLCGFQYARGPRVVTLDDDLQHPPEEIPALLAELDRGYDVVYGLCRADKHGLLRRGASWAARRVLSLAIPDLPQEFTSFRALRREVVRDLAALNMPFPFVDGGLTWITTRFGFVPVEAAVRSSGRSGYGVARLLAYSADILTTFSDLPLRLVSLAGLATAATGFVYGLVLVGRMLLRGDLLPGWTSLMAGLLFFSGLILAALGVLGEYLGRVNHKTTGRPRYVEREREP